MSGIEEIVSEPDKTPTEPAEDVSILTEVPESFVLAYAERVKNEINKKWEGRFIVLVAIMVVIFCVGYSYFSIKADNQTRAYKKLVDENKQLLSDNQYLTNARRRPLLDTSFPPILARPKFGPPPTIVINEYQYAVIFTTHEWLQANYAKAMSNADMKVIILDATQPIDKMRESLMHELLHLVKCEGSKRIGVRTDEDYLAPENVDHKFIEPASPTLLRTLQYNPKLVKWLEGR